MQNQFKMRNLTGYARATNAAEVAVLTLAVLLTVASAIFIKEQGAAPALVQLASVEAQMNGPGTPSSEMDIPPPDELPPTVHISATGFRVGSAIGDQTDIPLAADQSYDLAALHEHLEARHRVAPNERAVVLSADDGVEYHDIVATMDTLVASEYPDVTVAGEGL